MSDNLKTDARIAGGVVTLMTIVVDQLMRRAAYKLIVRHAKKKGIVIKK